MAVFAMQAVVLLQHPLVSLRKDVHRKQQYTKSQIRRPCSWKCWLIILSYKYEYLITCWTI